MLGADPPRLPPPSRHPASGAAVPHPAGRPALPRSTSPPLPSSSPGRPSRCRRPPPLTAAIICIDHPTAHGSADGLQRLPQRRTALVPGRAAVPHHPRCWCRRLSCLPGRQQAAPLRQAAASAEVSWTASAPAAAAAAAALPRASPRACAWTVRAVGALGALPCDRRRSRCAPGQGQRQGRCPARRICIPGCRRSCHHSLLERLRPAAAPLARRTAPLLAPGMTCRSLMPRVRWPGARGARAAPRAPDHACIGMGAVWEPHRSARSAACLARGGVPHRAAERSALLAPLPRVSALNPRHGRRDAAVPSTGAFPDRRSRWQHRVARS